MKNNILEEVYKVLETRRDRPIDSYTSNLMKDDKKTGEDKILEKIGEEAAELIIASKNDENVLEEAVDLLFHTFLLLVYKGIKFDEILDEFSKRRKPQ
ncbi:MAG TPA: phosphoribosyl-ATP diphosphatase [Methanothermobacter sp.]|jgi:phosphoribosyl-ATP pyrophosphohydrolase|uniref:Phosphoribosyl-ATP pyrophosphatase n=1 Tax=Methanothermobacter tenebrarum TaxID=680118 RepID=A0ABN6PA74_9EURY|nr:phosphoribosyl-ATP diphosphatase [Methanothermobacter tenebrarum]MDD3454112.1 phosphoribosyl-ATP diphosphatase [Methanobacteriales archaeon]MDI6882385.1 phosphoribosyl-ATP diphosphatase [Methanothermobacter sp.]MDX9693237.1 phosphoribosyl-ATP diphosphatase [Methanothermobacter sp.]BDH78778.1 phosphoribosyl-ATP pyrophosphatase [Methanothermobacter tenebrarum]HHW16992.1 phosphoribosyl-ATP diphosphatase [Methanothermobacter sp.]